MPGTPDQTLSVAGDPAGDPGDGPEPAGTGVGRLWTPVELAGFLGVPVKTVYRWHGQRTGPVALRVGRHLRYHPAEVHRWLATMADHPNPPGGTGG
jgi:excisionase family DNA binding protein